MARLTAENLALAARDHRPLPAAEVGARSRCCTSPRSRTATSPTTPWSTSPSWSASPRPRCSAPARFYEMFKREPVGALPRQRLHQHLLPAARRRGAARTTPRRRSASRPAAPPPTACSPSRTSSASRPAPRRPCLQVNYRYFHQRHPRRVRPADRRPARRPARRRGPAARHARPGPPAHPGRPRAPAPSRPTTRAEPVWLPHAAPSRRGAARRLMTVTDAPKIITSRFELRRRAHARRATRPPAATRACAGRAAR